MIKTLVQIRMSFVKYKVSFDGNYDFQLRDIIPL